MLGWMDWIVIRWGETLEPRLVHLVQKKLSFVKVRAS